MNVISKTFYKVVPTPFKSLVIVWKKTTDQPKVQRIFLSNERISATKLVDQIYPYAEIESCERIDGIVDKIVRFLNGEDIDFSLDIVNLDLIKPFQKSVLIAEHGIPRGWISTYRRLANHIGIPKGARAVGTALKNNPFPIIIPCHRAIKSDGSIGGFQGGTLMKQKLLEFEGVKFSSKEKVILDKIYYS
jgi:methylated-DNA-[protein]-cysteine S-methyltransferase